MEKRSPLGCASVAVEHVTCSLSKYSKNREGEGVGVGAPVIANSMSPLAIPDMSAGEGVSDTRGRCSDKILATPDRDCHKMVVPALCCGV